MTLMSPLSTSLLQVAMVLTVELSVMVMSDVTWTYSSRFPYRDGVTSRTTTEAAPTTTEEMLLSPFSGNVSGEEFWRQVGEAYRQFCSVRAQRCHPCYRDQLCQVYRDCCPDVYVTSGYHPPEDFLPGTVRCVRTTFGSRQVLPNDRDPDDIRSRVYGYTMVTRCPPGSDAALTSQCESQDTSRWKLTQPVTDMSTLVTYKNRYCAHCHSAGHNLTAWRSAIYVTRADDVTDVTSPAELYRLAVTSDDDDTEVVFFNPPSVAEGVRRCWQGWGWVEKEGTGYDSCNETGTWTYYDPHVQRACNAFTAQVQVNSTWFLTYSNLFCFLCNTDKSWTQVLREAGTSDALIAYSPSLPLLVLLDFIDGDKDKNNDEEDKQDKDGAEGDPDCCSDGQLYDWTTESCRNISCAVGKTLRGEDECHSILRTNNLYGFQFCILHHTPTAGRGHPITLSPAPTGPPTTATLPADWSLPREIVFAGAEQYSYNDHHLYVLRLFLSQPTDRDVADRAILSAVSQPHNLLTLFNLSQEVRGDFLHEFQRLVSHGQQAGWSPSCSPEVFRDLTNNSSVSVEVTRTWEGSALYVPQYRAIGRNVVFLPASSLLQCPHLQLGREEFYYDRDTEELVLRESEGRVGLPHYLITESYTAVVCVEEYMVALGNMSRNNCTATPCRGSCPDTGHVALYWVSLLSTIVSLVFLFISFLIYSVLPQLRTVAGCNNLLLIVVMFCSQLLLRLGVEVAMPDWLCQVMGGATHFFWLAVTFTQSACTFHMVFTLSFPFASHAAVARPAVLKGRYVMYVLAMSAMFVAVTLVWQWTEEGRSGYGRGSRDTACYITKGTVRLVTFAVPLACSVVVNVVMFVITIFSVRQTEQRVDTSTRSSKVSLVMYTKLSLFTGFTWLFGFLASGLQSLALAYVFAVAQGGQGLLIFLAFLATGSVWRMLRERWDSSRLSQSHRTAKNLDWRNGDPCHGHNVGKTQRN